MRFSFIVIVSLVFLLLFFVFVFFFVCVFFVVVFFFYKALMNYASPCHLNLFRSVSRFCFITDQNVTVFNLSATLIFSGDLKKKSVCQLILENCIKDI